MDSCMSHSTLLPSGDVDEFLQTLRNLLESPDFIVTRDLDILLKKSHEAPEDPFTTQNTLLDLDLNEENVKQQLLELEVAHYLETIIDNKDASSPPFHVFIKEIKHRDVYIKVKIRSFEHRKVFCVSFHYARYPIKKMPYST